MIATHHQISSGKNLPVPLLWQPYTDEFRSGFTYLFNINFIGVRSLIISN
jgi:hypothetical protein